jgi:hypothetical protein
MANKPLSAYETLRGDCWEIYSYAWNSLQFTKFRYRAGQAEASVDMRSQALAESMARELRYLARAATEAAERLEKEDGDQ